MNDIIEKDLKSALNQEDSLNPRFAPLNLVTKFIDDYNINNITSDATEELNATYNSCGYKMGYSFSNVSYKDDELTLNYKNLYGTDTGTITVKYYDNIINVIDNDILARSSKRNKFRLYLKELYERFALSDIIACERNKQIRIMNCFYLYASINNKNIKINDLNNIFNITSENDDIDYNDETSEILDNVDYSADEVIDNLLINIYDLPLCYRRNVSNLRKEDINRKFHEILSKKDNYNSSLIPLSLARKVIYDSKTKYHTLFNEFPQYLNDKYSNMIDGLEYYFFSVTHCQNKLYVKYFNDDNPDDVHELVFYREKDKYYIEDNDAFTLSPKYNELINDLRNHYEDYSFYNDLDLKNKTNIKTTNGFNIEASIGGGGIELYRYNECTDLEDMFLIQTLPDDNRVFTNKTTGDILRNCSIAKEDVFSHIFVKISDCPNCCIDRFTKLRQIQLANRYNKTDNQIFDIYLKSMKTEMEPIDNIIDDLTKEEVKTL